MSGLEGILAIVGVALAGPAVLDIIIKMGINMEKKVDAYKEMDENMKKFKLIGATMARGLLKKQLLIIREAEKNATQDKEYINALDGVFRDIVRDIIKADELFEKVYARGTMRKVRYASVSKNSLDAALKEFERNQHTFLSMVQYIQMDVGRLSTFELQPTDLVVHHETVQSMPTRYLRDSDIQLAQASYLDPISKTKKEGTVLVEERRITSTHDIKTIDNILEAVKTSNHGEGMLPCLGYRKTDRLMDGCKLFFQILVPGFQQSLLHYLQNNHQLPLNQRVKLCRQLAGSVSAIHSTGLVHKNIRPTNVLLVGDEPDKSLFLTDWTQLRVAQNMSTRITTRFWNTSFYQHPERRADPVVHDYTLAHDIYSLGVCMLEILLGKTFVTISRETRGPELDGEFRRRAIKLGPPDGIDADEFEHPSDIMLMQHPSLVKEVLLGYATSTLPWMAGETLAKLVVKMLQGFDGQFPTAATAPQQAGLGQQGKKVDEGMRYVQEVVQVLGRIEI